MPLGAFPFNTARSTPSIPSNPIFLSRRHAPPKQPLCDPRAMAALHHRRHPRYSIATAVCLPPVATSGHNGSTARRLAAGQGPCSSAPPRGTVLAGGQRRDVPAYLQTQCLVQRVLTPQSVSGVRIGDAAPWKTPRPNHATALEKEIRGFAENPGKSFCSFGEAYHLGRRYLALDMEKRRLHVESTRGENCRKW